FSEDSLPDGWTAQRHPEGALYFMHSDSKTFTEVNICNEEIFGDIEYFRDFLFSELQGEIHNRNLSGSLNIDEVQLVVEPKGDHQGVICCYYFVNPSSRSLFWLDDWQGDEIFRDCRGSRLRYPSYQKLMYALSCWFNAQVVFLTMPTADHLTSNRSSCPLNADELKNYLTLIDKISCIVLIGPQESQQGLFPGRIMHTFYNNYFLNFHGEECARLNFDQTIHGWRYHPSSLMTVCAPLLFMAPVTSVRSLHRIFVDDIASREKWNTFVNKLNSQLQDTNLLATVLLNANVGFLAIQSVDNGGGTTLRQLASYMSLVASLASIVLGLVFVGHHRTETRNTAFQAAKFLDRLQHKRHGLETLAIIYSLPYAFLMWGMVLFFAAFVSEWCGNSRDVKSLASVGGFLFLVACLGAWCIWTSREQTGLLVVRSRPRAG
ncbi:hypothetical protein BU15DRAFT_48882, partial [Melanogaster broomeanus]